MSDKWKTFVYILTLKNLFFQIVLVVSRKIKQRQVRVYYITLNNTKTFDIYMLGNKWTFNTRPTFFVV